MAVGSEVWTEKYRPKKFEEVVGQEEVIKRVKSLANSLNIPHLLFTGPAGTGKSTLALIVVHELFGENVDPSGCYWRATMSAIERLEAAKVTG